MHTNPETQSGGRWTPLEKAFLEDHRKLTRGLNSILVALENGDVEGARSVAEEMDMSVGPHFVFEEQHFYPKLHEHRGRDFVTHLYDEHEVGRRAIHKLLGDPAALDETTVTELVRDLRIMLDHAVGCGSLMSHLKALSPDEESRLLETLLELRRKNVRWTEMYSQG